jgi:hypothetical protein
MPQLIKPSCSQKKKKLNLELSLLQLYNQSVENTIYISAR